MALISLRLPPGLEAQLNRAAETSGRPRSAIARAAIEEYLAKLERERFVAAIAGAARARGEDPLALADEALALDNEALDLTEPQRVDDERPNYRAPRKKP